MLSRNRKNTGYALLVIAVLFALIPLWMVYRYKLAGAKPADAAATEDKKAVDETKPATERELRYLPVMIWGGALALIFMGGGVWYLLSEDTSPLNSIDAARLMVLTIGGLSGLVTVLFIGLALPYFEWWSVFIGTIETWRKEWWKIGITMLALFGGLALMFGSLQLARTDERSSPGLRRLLYGYNAVLTGLLVLAILVVLNVSTYVTQIPAWGAFFSKPSDWTASNIFTLSTASKNLLASIDEPMRIYVMLPKRSAVLYSEVENLMGNIRAVNRRIEIEYVPPDSRRERAIELMRKYSLTESVGILIVLTKEGREEHEFVPADDLGSADRSSPEKFSFKGENAVITKVRILTEGKSRATVYFAQGTGWLDMNDTTAGTPDRGLGVLRQRLERANFVVKELRLEDPSQERIPDDAAIVVLPRPSIPLSQRSLKALDSYMNSQSKDGKKGKLLVLLDVVTNRDGTFLQTGLEKYVEAFGVKVNDNRVLILPNNLTRFPLQIFATLNPNNRTTLADAFANEPPFLFTDTRSLDVIPSNPNNPLNQNSAEVLFQAPDRITLLEPPPLHPDPTGYMEELLKDVEKDDSRRQTVKGLLSQRPPALAVTVTEPKEPDPSGDPHARLRMKQEPRMVVFGDASWVANQAISRENSGFFELFVSTLNWLRERPEIGKMADDKERKFFTPSTTPEGIVRLQWLPGFLICLAIVGLGGGIWLVRRR
jgi:hypothetical protein